MHGTKILLTGLGFFHFSSDSLHVSDAKRALPVQPAALFFERFEHFEQANTRGLKTCIYLLLLLAGVGLNACSGDSGRSSGNVPPNTPSLSLPSPSSSVSSSAMPSPRPSLMPSSTSSPTPTVESSPEVTASPEPSPMASRSVTVQRIQWGESQLHYADLYRNANQEPLPVVVMIHGGCWQSGYSLRLQDSLSRALAERNIAVWNIEYRSMGSGGEWPRMFSDVAAATDYLPQLAQAHRLDLERVVAMGHSAGGHLALWLAGRHKIPESESLYRSLFQEVHGVVALGGIADLQSGACGSIALDIIDAPKLDSEQLAARLAISSPFHMLPIGKPSILISGEYDGIVPARIGEDYRSHAIEQGDAAQHSVIDGADHFYLINAESMDMDVLKSQVEQLWP